MSSHEGLSRREALRRAGLLAVAAPMVGRVMTATAQARPLVVDCHFHLWAADQQQYPFHPTAPYRPDYVSTLEQWLADRQGSGVDLGIFVHGEPYQDDHRYVLHCLERAPEVLRGTCLFDPNAPDSPRRMEELVRGKPFVAARVHSPASGGAVPEWRSRNFAAFWEKVGELGLVLQIHLQPQWAWELERMVQQYPGVRVVIDHLGRPRQGNAVDYEVILGLSRFPNVHMKVCSLDSQAEQPAPWPVLKPLMQEIARRFTPQRMVWGDGYRGGMGSNGYAGSLASARQLLDFMTTDDQAQVFGETARRLYRL